MYHHTNNYNKNYDDGANTDKLKKYLGVSVHHLCTVFQPKVMLYASQILKRDYSEGLTTYDIEDTLGGFLRQIMNSTSRLDKNSPPRCYAETLDGKDNVGKATHMLSYCWGNTIDDITTSLVEYCEANRLNVKRTYVWICFLCQKTNEDDSIDYYSNYLPPHNIETHYYYQQFEQQIVDIHNVLVLLVPPTTTTTTSYENNGDSNNSEFLRTNAKKKATVMPMYFTRVWCIFELYTAIERDCDVSVIMPPREREQFIKSILQQNTTTYGNSNSGCLFLQEFILALSSLSSDDDTSKLNIKYAETSDPEDKGSILQWINNNIKYGNDFDCYRRVNATVASFMKDWIDTEMIGKIIVQEAQQRRRFSEKQDSSTDLNLAAFYNGIGLIYKKNNLSEKDTERAMKYLSKSQAIYEKVLTNVYNDIGSVLLKQKPHEAKEYFTKSLVVIAAEQNVNDEALTFRTYKNLNLVHSKIGQLSLSSSSLSSSIAAEQSIRSNINNNTRNIDNGIDNDTDNDTTSPAKTTTSTTDLSLLTMEDIRRDIKEQELHELAKKEERRKQTETILKQQKRPSYRNIMKSIKDNKKCKQQKIIIPRSKIIVENDK